MWYCICDNKDGCNVANVKTNSWLITLVSVQIALFNLLFYRNRIKFF